MTREEAIKLLEHISIAYTPTDAYGDYDDPRPYEEAIDMAIEALSVIDIVDLTNGNTITKAEYDGEPSDLISRADVSKCIKTWYEEMGVDTHGVWNKQLAEIVLNKDVDTLALDFRHFRTLIDALPSAEAESDDLIIKGAKGIKDGLYNIKDGKLFQYKAKGGTVRTYPIVPSADRPKGEWIFNPKDAIELMFTKPKCSKCRFESSDGGNYCPNCGADMRGEKKDDD